MIGLVAGGEDAGLGEGIGEPSEYVGVFSGSHGDLMGIGSVADSAEMFGCEADGVRSSGDFDPKDLDFSG